MEESQPSRDSSIIRILSTTTGYITFFFSRGPREVGTYAMKGRVMRDPIKVHVSFVRNHTTMHPIPMYGVRIVTQ